MNYNSEKQKEIEISYRILAQEYGCKENETVDTVFSTFLKYTSDNQISNYLDSLTKQKLQESKTLKINPSNTPSGLVQTWFEDYLSLIKTDCILVKQLFDYLETPSEPSNYELLEVVMEKMRNKDYVGAIKTSKIVLIKMDNDSEDPGLASSLWQLQSTCFIKLNLLENALDSVLKGIQFIKEMDNDPESIDALNKINLEILKQLNRK